MSCKEDLESSSTRMAIDSRRNAWKLPFLLGGMCIESIGGDRAERRQIGVWRPPARHVERRISPRASSRASERTTCRVV